LKLYAVACNVLSRECYRAAANSPHVVTLSIQPFGLHSEPDELRKTLQAEIDRAEGYDYILLAYGLCSRGTADLIARETPIVIPRSHDCIALLLGSHQRYQDEFSRHPGTYYYSSGWVEHCEGEVIQGAIEIVKHRQYEERFKEYVEKYGEDNAKFLLEQETQWLVNYNRAVFLNHGLGDVDYYRRFTQKIASEHGWSYEELPGDTRLIDRLFAGNWDSPPQPAPTGRGSIGDSEFLIVRPGQRTQESVTSGIISAV